MSGELKLLTLLDGELSRFREKIIAFLLGLGDEKKTLFVEDYSEAEYREVCIDLVNRSVMAVIALSGDKIVGVSGFDRRRHGNLGDFLPLIFGYTVVDRGFQGKGVGSKLMAEKNNVMPRIPAFHIMTVTSNNVPMRRVAEKSSYKMVYEDESFAYYFKPCRRELAIFSPLLRLILLLHLRFNIYS